MYKEIVNNEFSTIAIIFLSFWLFSNSLLIPNIKGKKYAKTNRVLVKMLNSIIEPIMKKPK